MDYYETEIFRRSRINSPQGQDVQEYFWSSKKEVEDDKEASQERRESKE